MKQTLAIILSSIILLAASKDFVAYTAFKVNQGVITELFCINKAKPELKCGGKCYLMQKIKQSQEQEQDYPVTDQEERPVQIIDITDTPEARIIFANTSSPIKFDEQLPVRLFTSDIFHPPCA